MMSFPPATPPPLPLKNCDTLRSVLGLLLPPPPPPPPPLALVALGVPWPTTTVGPWAWPRVVPSLDLLLNTSSRHDI